MLRMRLLAMLTVVAVGFWGTTAWSLAVPRTSPDLTPAQREMVEHKEAARQSAGLSAPPSYPSGGVIKPQPSRPYTEVRSITSSEAEAMIEAARRESEAYWTRLETQGFADEAQADSARFEDEAAKLRGIAERGETLEIPMSEVGTHSIKFGQFSYNTPGGTAMDPVTVAWYDHGSAWDVNYDMRNWTSTIWEDTDGGVCQDQSQWVHIDELEHGGSQFWTAPHESLQRVPDQCAAGSRVHVRLFNGGYDAMHYYYSWSVGTPHKETADWVPPGHNITSWYDGRDAVRCSFMDSSCQYIQWYVQNMWYTFPGYVGFWKVHNLDGSVLMIRLLY